MLEVGVNLGVTICTDPDNRSFLRVGIEAKGIDPAGDVRAQAQASLTCAIEVIHILDDGLQESIVDIISDTGKAGLVKETLETHSDQIKRLGRALRAGLDDIASLKAAQENSDAPEDEARTDVAKDSPEPAVAEVKKSKKSKDKTTDIV